MTCSAQVMEISQIYYPEKQQLHYTKTKGQISNTTFICFELKQLLVIVMTFLEEDGTILQLTSYFHCKMQTNGHTRGKNEYLNFVNPNIYWGQSGSHFTIAPSFGLSYPSPSFNVFLRTFLSSVTSVTLFHDTNSRVICKVSFGGTAPSSLDAGLPSSPNPSATKWKV